MSELMKLENGMLTPIAQPVMVRRPKWADLPDSVGAEYLAGVNLMQIAVNHGTHMAAIKSKLDWLGVPTRPRGFIGGSGGPSKLTQDQIKWILEQDDQNVPHAEIARHVSVTRERVRQICLGAHKVPRRFRLTKGLMIKEAREARAQERFKLVQAISERYKAGAPFAELCAMLSDSQPGNSQGAGKISLLRKKYPDLFPYRQPNHHNIRNGKAVSK